MIKQFFIILLAATYLSGCLTTGDTRQSGTDDDKATKLQGTAAGAAVGGVIGALAGDTKGAVIGALIGAGVGYFAGSEVAKRKAAYAKEEDFLDAEIAQARQINQELVAYNTELREEIASLEVKSKRLAAQYKSGKLSRGKLIAERNIVQERLKTTRKVEKSLKREHGIKLAILEEQKEQRASEDPYVRSLERQVKELQTNIEVLHRGSTQLAQIDERLSV